MTAETSDGLRKLFPEELVDEVPYIIKLYERFFSHAIRDGAIFAFIGPGLGSEVYAMILACQQQYVDDFKIVLVDRPNSISNAIVGLLPFKTLHADYIREKEKVFSFLGENKVNTVIIRNTQTIKNRIPILTSFAEYAQNIRGHCLISVREEDYTSFLDNSLSSLGMQRFQRPTDIHVTEDYIYTL